MVTLGSCGESGGGTEPPLTAGCPFVFSNPLAIGSFCSAMPGQLGRAADLSVVCLEAASVANYPSTQRPQPLGHATKLGAKAIKSSEDTCLTANAGCSSSRAAPDFSDDEGSGSHQRRHIEQSTKDSPKDAQPPSFQTVRNWRDVQTRWRRPPLPPVELSTKAPKREGRHNRTVLLACNYRCLDSDLIIA
jgi:hypothetical protein